MAYDSSTDAAVWVFETKYGIIITVEIGGQIEVFHDNFTCPETYFEYRIKKLMEKGFKSNNQKLFSGKFTKEDPVCGIEVVWEPVYKKVERDAKEEYDRDMADPRVKKPLQDMAYYLYINDWYPNGGYLPVTVSHLTTLEIRTSPEVLDTTLSQAMEKIQNQMAVQGEKQKQ